jgi:SNF2 family DNA or RNA helicase
MDTDMQEFEHLAQDCERYNENWYDLRGILRSKKRQRSYFEELGTASTLDVKQHVQSIMNENMTQIAQCTERMNVIATASGFSIEDYYILKALNEAHEHDDATWKKEADAHLESIRPCKRTRGNVTTTIQLGATGFQGSGKEDLDAEIDVLDEAAKPDVSDRTYSKLNFFTTTGDDSEQEKPSNTYDPKAIKIESYIIAEDLAKLLKPHQQEAARQILKAVAMKASGFLLAHSMGLGKTLTTIAVLQGIFSGQAYSSAAQESYHHICIACPKTLLNHWYSELEKWDDYLTIPFYPPIETEEKKSLQMKRWEKKGGVIIMTHNRIAKMTLEEGFSADLLVVDEAHLMKNPTSQLYEAMNRHSEPKILLTGSPLQNHLNEYYQMIRLIKPDLIKPEKFRSEFAKVIDRGAFAGASAKDLAAARTKIAVLTRLTEPYVHRRSAAALKSALKPMKEYKLCYDAPHLTKSQNPLERSNETITASISIKIKKACILLDSIAKAKDKTLVFSRRKDVLTTLQKKRQGLFMDGDTSANTRHALVEHFQNSEFADKSDTNIFYMTTKVGGVGLNLHSANRILILDPSWNPVDDKQACFRIFRYGQTKTCRVYRFIVGDSIEERIYRLAVHKNLAACRIVDDKDVNRHFTEDQLKVLDEFEHETLDSTGGQDKALDRVIQHFQVSSHDVLFADSDTEKLTEDEKNDADNQYNKVLYFSDRIIDDKIYNVEMDYCMTDGTLIPPLPPVYTSHALPGHKLTNWEPLRPFTLDLKYKIHLKAVDDSFEDIIEFEGKETQTLNWPVQVPDFGSYRLRCKSMIQERDQESEWSDWSAVVKI